MAKHGWKDQGRFWENEDGDAVTWDAQAQELGVQIHAADNDGHRDGETEIPLPVLRALLAAQGLHVVSEAERLVIDCAKRLNPVRVAMRLANDDELEDIGKAILRMHDEAKP